MFRYAPRRSKGRDQLAAGVENRHRPIQVAAVEGVIVGALNFPQVPHVLLPRVVLMFMVLLMGLAALPDVLPRPAFSNASLDHSRRCQPGRC